MKNSTTFLIGVTTLSLLLSGCAQKLPQRQQLQDDANRRATLVDESGARSIQRAQAQQVLAISEDLAVYAPLHLRNGNDQLAKAQHSLSRNRPDQHVKNEALLALNIYNAGLANKIAVKQRLAPSYDHLAVLRALYADRTFPSEFQSIEHTLPALIDLFEQQKLPRFEREQKALHERMTALEIKTVEFQHLHRIKQDLAKTEQLGAAKIAPQSWQAAQQTLAQAQALIAATPRALADIQQAARATDRASQHAAHITAFSTEVLNAKRNTAEATALKVEQWLYQLAITLQHDDIRHLPFDQQVEAYRKAIQASQRQR